MSTKAVIIALLVALVLGIGAYLVLQPGAKPAVKADVFGPGEQVCKIEPGAVASIEIESPNGDVQTIRRGQGGAAGGGGMTGFTLTVGRQSAPQGPVWPMEEGRVPNLLQILSNARSLDAPDEKAELDADAMRVTIREENGGVTHLLLSTRSLAGRGLVKVVSGTTGDRLGLSELRARGGKLGVIDGAIQNVFRQPGPRGWRDGLALHGMGPEVSRLRLMNNDLSLRLARVEGKWMVQQPVAAPADAAQVSRLIGTLSALRITSFLDEPDAIVPGPEDTGLEQPLATITSETDRRVLLADPGAPGGDVSVRTETRELLIGKPADTAGETRYARMGKDGPVVVISGAGLTREVFDAAGYVAKNAVDVPAADVGMLVLEPAADAPTENAPEARSRVFRRDLDKWKEVTGATETALDDTMTKAVEELVKFLTSEAASSLALGPPVAWKEEGRLVVGSLAGTPLDTIVLGSSEGTNLGIRTGGGEDGRGSVYRWYPREKVPRILSVVVPKPVEPVKAPAGVPDVVK